MIDPRRLSVAPMMDRTDRHFRWWFRRLTRHTELWTEMVTAAAVVRGDRDKLLRFHADEHRVVLQLGGDDPGLLAEAAQVGAAFGYDEINLNVGCPSPRVASGNFGAALMLDPPRVARCVHAMRAAVSVPVSVKHRIGVDDKDQYSDMKAFVAEVADAGCERFVVHARKAWLNGLSPKANREIPPLMPELVYRLKDELPALRVEVNGGVRSLAAAVAHLQHVDGVMIGRAAVDDPYLFASVDQHIFGQDGVPSRAQVARALVPGLDALREQGEPLHRLWRHALELYAGRPGTRAWKRAWMEAPADLTPAELVERALAAVDAVRRPEGEIL